MTLEILRGIGRELTQDKWLAFALVVILLVAFIKTSNDALEQLLVTAVGGLLGLMRGRQAQTTNIEANSPTRIEAFSDTQK